jgi:hypothetical protein
VFCLGPTLCKFKGIAIAFTRLLQSERIKEAFSRVYISNERLRILYTLTVLQLAIKPIYEISKGISARV